MKKIILFLAIGCVLLLPSTAQAQNYHPFIDTSKHWDVMHYGQQTIFDPCSEVMGARYFFEGDTVIQDITYQILWAHPVVSLSPDQHFCPPFAVYTGSSYIESFIREDVEKQQVFRYFPSNEQEEILYDFTLQEGDFLGSYEMGWQRLEVIQIDSVELLNGEKRRRLHFYFDRMYQHIEGIGNTFGPTYMEYGLIDYEMQLECFVENNEFLYDGEWGGNACFSVLATNENPVREKIRIYPNPIKSDGELTIISNEPLKELALYDLKGTLVQTIETTNSQQTHRITLNAETNSGIYILKVQTIQNQIYHEKIILY